AFRALGLSPRTYTQTDLESYLAQFKQIQKRTGEALPGATPQSVAASETRVQRTIDNLRARGLLTLPTPYEEPQTYLEMAITLNELEEGMIRVFGRPLAPRPIFGTLPSAHIQASVEPINGEYLLIFETGLIRFAALVTRIIARAMPGHEAGEKLFAFTLERRQIVEHLQANDDIVDGLARLLLAYLVQSGTSPLPDVVPQKPLPKSYDVLAADLYRSMLLFAFS